MWSRWAIWLLVGSASCAGDPFVGDISHSRYFEYHDQVTEPLCPTLLDRLDQHAEMIGGKISLTLDLNRPFRYFRFRDQVAFAANSGGCPSESYGCAHGDWLATFTYFQAHEQSHDYGYRVWGGWSNGLLDEGVAVAMSCSPFFSLWPGQKPTDILGGTLDWRDLLHLRGDSLAGYAAAAFFVTLLANQYGWGSVGAFYKKVSWDSSADDVAKAFADVFPTSIDQAWSDALDTPGAAPCQMDWQCMTTPMAVGDVVTPDCDGEIHRSVEVGASEGGVVLLPGGGELILRSCVDPTPTHYVLPGSDRQITHWISLPPGSYTVFAVEGLPASTITLQSKFSGPLVGNSCASAGSVALDPTAAEIDVDFPADGLLSDGWMRLAGGGHRYSVVNNNLFWDGSTSGPLSICTDCSATSCVPLPYGQATNLTISDQAVVHFQNVVTRPNAWSRTLATLEFDPE